MYTIQDFTVIQDTAKFGKYWLSKDKQFAILRHPFEETYFILEYIDSEWIVYPDQYDSIPQCMDKINGVFNEDEVKEDPPF